MLRKERIFVTILLLLFILVVWTIWGNVTVGVTHYTVTSNRLPHSFDGYKIAVVSDLHNVQFGNNNNIERIIESANALKMLFFLKHIIQIAQ